MLYITIGDKQVQWRVGEELPEIYSRVVKFQADGDELELILSACRETYVKRMMLAEEELFPGTLRAVEPPKEEIKLYDVSLIFSNSQQYEIARIAREVAREEIQRYKDDEEIPF